MAWLAVCTAGKLILPPCIGTAAPSHLHAGPEDRIKALLLTWLVLVQGAGRADIRRVILVGTGLKACNFQATQHGKESLDMQLLAPQVRRGMLLEYLMAHPARKPPSRAALERVLSDSVVQLQMSNTLGIPGLMEMLARVMAAHPELEEGR